MYACFGNSDPVAFAQCVERLAALEGVVTTCPGHNDIITGRAWLGEVAEGVAAAVAGKVVGPPRDDLMVGHEFRFGALSLCRSEGQRNEYPDELSMIGRSRPSHPEAMTVVLREAMEAWERCGTETTHAFLGRVLTLAQEFCYLCAVRAPAHTNGASRMEAS